ncbi:MAG: hypothetical protein JNK05_37130 [Myxococcales bacterium]|nr:hypothetical protein [Myxococcales bacterium]
MAPRRGVWIEVAFVSVLVVSRISDCRGSVGGRVIDPPRPIEPRDDTTIARVVERPRDEAERVEIVRPGFRHGERARRRFIDETHAIDRGMRQKLVRGRWIDAREVFTSPIVAAARIDARWFFATLDGALFSSEDFLSPVVQLGELHAGALEARWPSASRGALPVIDQQKRLWIVRGNRAVSLVAALEGTRVVSAAFDSASHGAALTEWGHILKTNDGGATFREVAWRAGTPRGIFVERRMLVVTTDESTRPLHGPWPEEPATPIDEPSTTAESPAETPAADRTLEPVSRANASGEAALEALDDEQAESDFADSCDGGADSLNGWFIEEFGRDQCRSLSRAAGLGWQLRDMVFARWGSSVAVEASSYRFGHEYVRATRDAQGRWHVGAPASRDIQASARARYSDDGRTMLTVGRCERDPYSQPLDETALCWREFDDRGLRRHRVMEVPPRSQLVHGHGAIVVMLEEDKRSVRVLDFAANSQTNRVAASLAPTLRAPRVEHVRTMLPSGRSYAVLVGEDGRAQLRLDLERADGASIALPDGAIDGAIDDQGRTLAIGTHANKIWRRLSARDPWGRVELDVEAGRSRVELHGVSCAGDSCVIGPFEIPWSEARSSVSWYGARREVPVVREAEVAPTEHATIACEDHRRIYNGARISSSDEASSSRRIGAFLLGPGAWAYTRSVANAPGIEWSDRYRNPTWTAHGPSAEGIAITTAGYQEFDEPDHVLAAERSGLLLALAPRVAWIPAGQGRPRVLNPRGEIETAAVTDDGFVLLREDAKLMVFDRDGRVVAERHNEVPVADESFVAMARMSGRWGVIAPDPSRAGYARFVEASTGSTTALRWDTSRPLRVCEEPERPGADFVKFPMNGWLETREQYVRTRHWGLHPRPARPIATLEFEREQPCVRSVALWGQWDEAPWVGTREGIDPDSAIILRAAPGQRLVGYDIARGDTPLECTLRRPQGARLGDE